jgi:hypothetical protein
VDRCRSPAHRQFVSCQRPRSFEHVRSYRPSWRQRQDSHLNPRRHNLLATWPVLSRGLEAKTKKAFQGIALEGLVLDECRAFRALCPPWGYQASCRSGSGSTVVSWICAHTRRLARRWPNRTAALSMSTANWRIVSSLQPRPPMYDSHSYLSMTKWHSRPTRCWPL